MDTLKLVRRAGLQMLSASLPEKTSMNVEKSVYNYASKMCDKYKKVCDVDQLVRHFRRVYAKKIRSVSFNMKHCETFREGIIQNKFSYHTLPMMQPDDMNPNGLYAVMKQRLAKREAKQEEMRLYFESKHQTAQGLYTCNKCKSGHTVFNAVQIRGADEPMTIFVTCMACNNRWKE